MSIIFLLYFCVDIWKLLGEKLFYSELILSFKKWRLFVRNVENNIS